jgi:hypothetical protein
MMTLLLLVLNVGRRIGDVCGCTDDEDGRGAIWLKGMPVGTATCVVDKSECGGSIGGFAGVAGADGVARADAGTVTGSDLKPAFVNRGICPAATGCSRENVFVCW